MQTCAGSCWWLKREEGTSWMGVICSSRSGSFIAERCSGSVWSGGQRCIPCNNRLVASVHFFQTLYVRRAEDLC